MHAVGVLHGNAARLAFNHPVVHRTGRTVNRLKKGVQGLGGRHIASQEQFSDDVDIEAAIPPMRVDRCANGHRPLRVEPRHLVVEGTVRTLNMLAHRREAFDRKFVKAWRQLDSNCRFSQQDFAYWRIWPKGDIEGFVHGKNTSLALVYVRSRKANLDARPLGNSIRLASGVELGDALG